MSPKDLLKKAHSIVNGDRQRDYGSPQENHACTADMWAAYLIHAGWKPPEPDNDTNVIGAWPITERDVCNLNILQKLSRDAHRPKDDNDVDIVGYVLNKAMMSMSPEVEGVVKNEPVSVIKKQLPYERPWPTDQPKKNSP